MININPASGKPLYEQIVDSFKSNFAKGYLKSGDEIPSVRKLAMELSVTPNTVAKAYQELERDKIIVTVLITSHNILELERICDSVTMIKNGKVTDCQDVEVRKFNYVFKESAPEEFLNNPKILSISNTGSIYTVIYNGITEEELEANSKLNPVYIEELQINLEEVFVHINGGAADEK